MAALVSTADIAELDEAAHEIRVCLDKAENFHATAQVKLANAKMLLYAGKYGKEWTWKRWVTEKCQIGVRRADHLIAGQTGHESRDRKKKPIVTDEKPASNHLQSKPIVTDDTSTCNQLQSENDADERYSWPCIPSEIKEIKLNNHQQKTIEEIQRYFKDRRSQRILITMLQELWPWLQS